MEYKNIKVGISTKCKNEINIIEFIEHYLNLGFSYFFFLDDNSKPSINSIIKDTYGNKYNDIIKIVVNSDGWEDNTNHNLIIKFTKIINIHLDEIKQHVNYLLNVDMDEYLVLKNSIFENKIQNVITYYEPFDMLKINWLYFGNNNLKNADCSTLKDKFTKSSNILSNPVKSLVKLESYNKERVSSHVFSLKANSIVKNVFNNIDVNNPKSNLQQINKNRVNLYLAHYVIQSTEYFVQRRLLTHTKCKIQDTFYLPYKNIYTLEELYEKIQKEFNNNKQNLINHFHINEPLNDNLKIFKDGIHQMKIFFNINNKNDIDNFDLLEN